MKGKEEEKKVGVGWGLVPGLGAVLAIDLVWSGGELGWIGEWWAEREEEMERDGKLMDGERKRKASARR